VPDKIVDLACNRDLFIASENRLPPPGDSTTWMKKKKQEEEVSVVNSWDKIKHLVEPLHPVLLQPISLGHDVVEGTPINTTESDFIKGVLK
jgi:hypothetical protein